MRVPAAHQKESDDHSNEDDVVHSFGSNIRSNLAAGVPIQVIKSRRSGVKNSSKKYWRGEQSRMTRRREGANETVDLR